MNRLVILLGMCLVYTSAMAEYNSRYKVELAGPIAQSVYTALSASTNATGGSALYFEKTGPFGPCMGKVFTLAVGDSVLNCQDRTSCSPYTSHPSCTVSFVSANNQSSDKFCPIQGSPEPITYNRNNPPRVLSAGPGH